MNFDRATWKKTTIGESFIFTSKPRNQTPLETIEFIPMEAISAENEKIDRSQIKKLNKVTSGTYIENGDLLLAKITPSFENGKQGFAELSENYGYATTEVIAIKGIDGVSDNRFLAYWLRQKEIQAMLAGKMEGTTGRQRLSKSVLEKTEILLPPLEEQQQIIDSLNTFQNAITRQRSVKHQLTELKKSVMRYLFTHGTRGEKTKMTEIGEVPLSWDLTTVGDICKLEYGKGLSTNTRIEGPIPVYGSNGIVGYHNESFLNGKGIIIGRKGSVGQVHFSNSKFFPIDTTFYITQNETKENLRFLFYLLQHTNLSRLRGDVGVPGLNRDVAYNTIVVFPKSLNEQEEIATILDIVEEAIAVNYSKYKRYNDLFSVMLNKLMVQQL